MTEYQKRQIAGALPTGDNAIGKLAANDGVDIGDVDVKSIAAGDNNIGNVDIVTLPALPTGTNIIGEVKPVDNAGNHQASMDAVARAGFAKITDGTETASVNTNNQLETSPEHSLKGKTILFGTGIAIGGHATLLTVTAGKTFYLLAATLSAYATVDDVYAVMYMESTTKRLMEIYSNITPTYKTSFSEHAELTFPHPIPLAATLSVKIYSTNADMYVRGSCVGWEE